MPWTIERKHDHVAVVTMNTNKVNAQNPVFFADLQAAFDRLEAEFDDCAVVLTGTGKVFSAGLDLDHHFECTRAAILKRSTIGSLPIALPIFAYSPAGDFVLTCAVPRKSRSA
jgi:enoyl-CoA hydratase/carnithine racemase